MYELLHLKITLLQFYQGVMIQLQYGITNQSHYFNFLVILFSMKWYELESLHLILHQGHFITAFSAK